tara:strand:+ start:279 stop:542 length:264 start_codon:yes stop_codon:yes gene_type:complete
MVYIEMPITAQPLLQWLQSQGIDASMSSDDAGGLHPALTFVHGTWLTVPSNQTTEAKELIEQFERSLILIDDSFPAESEQDVEPPAQ